MSLVGTAQLLGTVTQTLTTPGTFLLLNINLHMILNNVRSLSSSQEALQSTLKRGTYKLLCNFYPSAKGSDDAITNLKTQPKKPKKQNQKVTCFTSRCVVFN